MIFSELVDNTFMKILTHYGEDVDPSNIPEEQRTVLLVYGAHGIIGNGGFQYLFESDCLGDPDLLLTRHAFKMINAENALSAFTKALAVFPNSSLPTDIKRRLEIYQSYYSTMDAFKDNAAPDAVYFQSMDETLLLLESYVRKNQSAFTSLK